MAVERVLQTLIYDLQVAIRGLTRNRSFTIAAIVALGLGIGAGTAVFSVVDRVLFRSLPYPHDDRLVSFGMVAPIAPQEFVLSYDYLEWREAATPFESMGAWLMGVQDCDINDARPVRLQCAKIDSRLLPTLGTELIAGRNFTAAEERPNAPGTALISASLWRQRFGSEPSAVGRTIQLDGHAVTIAGILPPQFDLPSLERIDILLPHVLDEPEQRSRRAAIPMFVVGRLKPGITPRQATVALEPVFRHSLEFVTASFRKDVKLRVRPLRDRQTQDARLASWVLFGSVLAVLLIACANVANLELARAVARERELAVRAALGAGRGRLVRQALAESLLLSLAGAVAGCILAFVLLHFFVAIAPAGIPYLHEATVDLRVLLFALALTLGSGVLFGLAPARQAPHLETLAGGRPFGFGRYRLRQWLVAGQIAVSVILLTGAGLLLRSLWNLENQPLGMRADNVVVASVMLGRTAYPTPAARLGFFEELERRLRLIPGAAEVAIADSIPPAGSAMGSMLYAAIDVQGRPRFTDGTGGLVIARSVTPGYFAALGIPILQGRAFLEEDRFPNHNGVILSDALARRLFPGGDPLSRQIRPGRLGAWLSVIGVAGNVKNNGLVERESPEYYVVRKHSPEGMRAGAAALIRTGLPAAAMSEWARREIAALDGTLPVDLQTMRHRIGEMAARPRFNALLLSIFAGLGVLLAVVGLYGVISLLVAQRSQEIGVRMAMGATPAAIARMVLRQAGWWTISGAAVGMMAAFWLVRLLEHMLFGIAARDPWTMAGSVSLLSAVAILAALIPSRRAARTDPIRVLRQE